MHSFIIRKCIALSIALMFASSVASHALGDTADGPAGSMMAQTAAYPFDGKWIMEMYRRFGGCRGYYELDMQITEGQISGSIQARTGTFSAKGSVASDGTIEHLVLENGDIVRMKGTMSGDGGEGSWETDSGCDGTFTLTRSPQG